MIAFFGQNCVQPSLLTQAQLKLVDHSKEKYSFCIIINKVPPNL